MAELHLITLSQANGNDTDAQRWLLRRVCNRVHYLGEVSLTAVGSTYNDLTFLITRLTRLYHASGQNYREVNGWLKEKLAEVESKYDENVLAEERSKWEIRVIGLSEDWELEMTRGEELRSSRVTSFFHPSARRWC